LQNVTDVDIKNSPAFIYTTSNDVVWQQQTVDSVGFNYIDNNMSQNSNTLSINNNDLLDIFHTFNMDTNGYVAVEKEIMSFEYKQYTISNTSGTKSTSVSIKNSLELASQINNFIKQNTIGLRTSDGSAGQNYDYDVVVEPTGNITNVQRGMFGTIPAEHSRVTSLSSKGLLEKSINSSFVFSSSSGKTLITNNSDNSAVLPNVTKIGLRPEGSSKVAVCPSSETTNEYKTYSVKFDIPDQYVASAGLYINQSSSGSHTPLFVELIKVRKTNSEGIFLEPESYSYMMAIYDSSNLYAYTDVTGACNNILRGLPRIAQFNSGAVDGDPKYTYVTDDFFNLRVVLNATDGSDGENGSVANPNTAMHVYLNNTEVTGWQVPDTSDSVADWSQTNINTTTGIPQKPTVPEIYSSSKSFGFYASVSPRALPGISYPTPVFAYSVANLREIHATEKPLFERSTGYFYQDREFLNGLVQKQPLYSNYQTYLMQTTPEISGINYYDVQYTTPAAVSVDVFPIQYMMSYFPGNSKEQQQYKQKKLVTEDSLAYSTPLNTGFRARMAIANSSPHMVILTKESDEVIRVAVNLNLWTHEIVAPSDPEILEVIIDPSNMSEVVQLDSEWIQSKSAANKMLKIVEMGVDGFSTTTTLSMFGNPLIQIGDFVMLSYDLNGTDSKRNIVTAVSHSFNNGLNTTLTLKRLS
jgi:hypothetical protein